MNHRIGAETLPMNAIQAVDVGSRAEAAARAWRFDGFEFDLHRSELHGPDGAAIALRPKAETLLRQFLGQPGRLFSREELMAALWPAAVVTDDSLVQCVGELRAALDDRTQRMIRTVPRRGYRWEAQVEPVNGALARDVLAAAAAAAPRAPAQAERQTASAASHTRTQRLAWTNRTRAWSLVAALATSVGTAAYYVRSIVAPVHIDERIAARNTVAVMPFVVSVDDPELRTAADAIADEITAQLATRIGMRGIGRTAAKGFDGAAPPLDRMAEALKATLVVTGRVGRIGAGDRIGIDVQLIAVPGQDAIWARHFERAVANDVRLTPDVGEAVVNAVRNRGNKSDKVHDALADQEPDAVHFTLQGWRDLDQRKSLADVWRARARFEKALRTDPESVIALNGLGATYSLERADPTSHLTAEQRAEHERVVERARMLAPEDSTALLLWGNMQVMLGRADLALPAAEKAARLVPSYPFGHLLVGRALLMLGRTAEVQAHADRAIEVGAGDARRISGAYALAAEAALMLGDNDRAYDLARRSTAEFPSNAQAHATLAAVDALSGRNERAATEMARFLQLWPTATVARYDELHRSTDTVYLAQRERLFEGLRKAGLPEQ
jgi:DNA-binding winged helix-turn-helix (wHTH) protein/TolB-like protein